MSAELSHPLMSRIVREGAGLYLFYCTVVESRGERFFLQNIELDFVIPEFMYLIL